MSDSPYQLDSSGNPVLKKDGTPMLKRGRRKGSGSAPKFITSKTNLSTGSKRRGKYSSNPSKAAENTPSPSFDPGFMDTVAWWKERYAKLEKATKELMTVIDDGVERDNIEESYRLTFKTSHAYKDKKFTKENDPVNRVYRLLYNEDMFEAKMKAV